MVSAEHHGKRAAGIDMRYALADLIEGLLDVAGNGKHVADIADGNGFPQIHAELEAVGAVQRGDLANPLGAEPGARPIGRPAIERRAENGHIVLPAFSYIFDIWRLDKGVDAGEVRKLSSAERGNPAIFDGIGALQAQFKASGNFFFIFRGRQQRLRLDRILRLWSIFVMQWNLALVCSLFRHDGSFLRDG